MIRRVTIAVTLVVVAVSLGVGIYLVSLANRPSSIDSKLGEPVSLTDLTNLYHASLQPYGPSPTSTMSSQVQTYDGSPFVSNGKPTVVYVGADYCEFCAAQRWGLVMALMRFGNFSGLQYMASASGSEGDYATFTFSSTTYSSRYVVFQPFEVDDRAGKALVTVPANYSSVWQHFGKGFPFMDFGNKYVVAASTLLPGGLAGRNWSQIIGGISSGDQMGLQIKQSANLLTALICKLTNDAPSSVCAVPPISDITSGIAGAQAATIGLSSGLDGNVPGIRIQHAVEPFH